MSNYRPVLGWILFSKPVQLIATAMAAPYLWLRARQMNFIFGDGER